MKILSIDVGIKNLAYCYLGIDIDASNIDIKDWDVVNLINNEKNDIKCDMITKKPCCSMAKYSINGNYYCLRHAKKTDFIIPKPEYQEKKIKNSSKKKICDICDNFKIEYENTDNKTIIIEKLNKYLGVNMMKKIEEEKAKESTIIDLGKSLMKEFDKIFKDISFDKILIENQINPIANKMGTLQGMITQYFIMREQPNIYFISAANKLKPFIGNSQKTNYKERKALGIDITEKLINKNSNLQEWLNLFKTHKKKDDLADSLLQGLWYLSNNYKLNLKN